MVRTFPNNLLQVTKYEINMAKPQTKVQKNKQTKRTKCTNKKR